MRLSWDLAKNLALGKIEDPEGSVSFWSKLYDKYGLPLVILGLVLVLAWRFLGWMRPYADRVANEIVTRPGFLEAQAARDAATAARDQIQAELIKQLCERVSTQSELTRQMLERVTLLIEIQRPKNGN